VLERVTATVRRHDMLHPGDTVLVCVSGGPDSMCLLESLVRLRRLFRIRLEVFTFDHRLREGSAADVAYVRRAAARLRLPAHVEVAEGAPPAGASVEAWGTIQRMRAADRVRQVIGAQVVAEGHTIDDQAETVLLNLLRGTGLDGLAGIWPVAGERPSPITVQPLFDVSREEVEASCRALGLRPRRDPMNEDRRYLRSAIRHEVLPAIERATGREVRATLARTAEVLAEDRDELMRRGLELERNLVRHEHDSVRLDAAGLARLPRAAAARVVRRALWNLLTTDEAAAPWTRASVDAVLDLATGRPGRRRHLPNGREAVREKVYVLVSRPSP
jgi:tRNA(Ile)-lysidine synthetase-like protein